MAVAFFLIKFGPLRWLGEEEYIEFFFKLQYMIFFLSFEEKRQF